MFALRLLLWLIQLMNGHGSDWTELIKKRREALRMYICRGQKCVCPGSANWIWPVIVLHLYPTSVWCGTRWRKRLTFYFNCCVSTYIPEQREMEQRDQSTTHEVCRRATAGSRHNGKRQGRKKCTVLAMRRISSSLHCYLEESTIISSV